MAINKCYAEYAATCPIHCNLNDGTMAIVKYPNNLEGNLILFNEFISYKIAEVIGLKVPSFGICELDGRAAFGNEYASQIKSDSNAEIITSDNFGICFYSEFIRNTMPFKPFFIRDLSNLENFQLMIIFDHIIYNKDRHPGNILISPVENIFYAIDHSHVFKNQCIWDSISFEQGIASNDYCDKDIVELNSDTYESIWRTKKFDIQLAKKQAEEIQSILTPRCISDIINQLPKEWFSYISLTDLKSLEKYLNYRILNLQSVIDTIYEAKEELFHEKN